MGKCPVDHAALAAQHRQAGQTHSNGSTGTCPVNHAAPDAAAQKQASSPVSHAGPAAADLMQTMAVAPEATAAPAAAAEPPAGGRCPFGYVAPKGPQLSPLHCPL